MSTRYKALALLAAGLLIGRLAAQTTTITGRVTDEGTGRGITVVNVFLANTTMGTITDEFGYFAVKNVPVGAYEIVFQHIGYELRAIEIQLTSVKLWQDNITLVPKVLKGEKVDIVAVGRRGWRKSLKKFRKEFIGESLYAGKCELLNPEVLDFYMDEATDNLVAHADSILVLDNRALGYRIHIILDSFIWNLYEPKGRYSIYSRFIPLQPENGRELRRWRRNRLACYKGSLKHFLASLARGQAEENGFKLYTGSEYSFDLGLSGLITSDMIYLVPDEGTSYLQLAFNEDLKVVYQHGLGRTSTIRLEESIALIDSFGNNHSPRAITTFGDWAQRRMVETLPLDYLPE